METILTLIRKQKLSVTKLAKAVGCHYTQIYYWDKHGIKSSSTYYPKLKELVPGLEAITIKREKAYEPEKRLLDLLKEKNLTPADLANVLDVPITRIYQWNKNGLSINSPYFDPLIEIIPEFEPNNDTSKRCLRRGGKRDELDSKVESDTMIIPQLRECMKYRDDLRLPNYELEGPNLILEDEMWEPDYKKILENKLKDQPELEGPPSLKTGGERPRKSAYPKIIRE